MKQYHDLLSDIMQNGVVKGDRTGTGTLSVFGRQLRFDLSEGFPIVTTRKINFKAIVAENLWFLKGHSHIDYLKENGVHIWEAWATEEGDIGPMYGKQLRDFGVRCTDQVSEVLKSLKANPDSRRHLMTTWSVDDLPIERFSPQDNVKSGLMALAPCHGIAIQFYVADGKLSCSMYQRSADVFIGSCYNIAGYALLTHLFAQQCGYEVGELIYTTGDTHLYLNHLEQAEMQLSRQPYPLPKLIIKRKPESIFDYQIDDFELDNYRHHLAIHAPVAV